MRRLHVLVIATSLASLMMGLRLGGATTITHDLTIDPNDGTIDDGAFEDVWTSPRIFFPRRLLNGGDMLVLNVDFSKDKIKITDEFIDDDESIRFFIGGGGGVGGGLAHALPYVWTFTDVKGDLEVNPITGTGCLGGATGNGLIDPDCTVDQRDIDLTDSMFSFKDIMLKVTVPGTIGAPWQPNFVTLAVDGDVVSIKPKNVPAPSATALFGIGLMGIVAARYRRRDRERTPF